MKLICNLIGLIMIGCFFMYLAPGLSMFFGFMKPLIADFPHLPLAVFVLLSLLALFDFGSLSVPTKDEFYVWHAHKGVVGPMPFSEARTHPANTLITTEYENFWWPCYTWTHRGTQPTAWDTRVSVAGFFMFLAAGYSWFQFSEVPAYPFVTSSVAVFCVILAHFLPGQRGVPQKPAAHLLSAIFCSPRPPDFDV
jgi:hypothetical protein